MRRGRAGLGTKVDGATVVAQAQIVTRPRRRRARFAAIVLALTVGVQVPAVLAVTWLTRLSTVPLLVIGSLSAIFVVRLLRNPWEHAPRSRWDLYLAMWPFYVWWTVCVVFLLLAPLALLATSLGLVPLRTALTAALVTSAAGGVWSLRRTPRITRRQVSVVGLPAEFDRFRIVQLTDVHCGPFTPAARVRWWVRRANRLGADAFAVTGDLITSGAHHVAAVASALGELRAPEGRYACMGNHDYFTDGDELVRALERQGIDVLRNRGVTLRRGEAQLHIAGVDDTWTRRHDLNLALEQRPHGVPVVLLAHDPDVFPAAAAAGVALTIAGHTHGGQFALPGMARRANLARFMTRFTSGLYRQGPATLFVGLGLGTSGPPIRLGAPPELAVLTLVRADESPAEQAHSPARMAGACS